MARSLQGALPDEVKTSAAERKRASTAGNGEKSSSGEKRPRRVVVSPPERAGDAKQQENRPMLRFSYEMLMSSRLWEFDAETGVLTFNVRHPTWVRLDETDGKRTARNDRQIMHLQEWLTLKLLLILSRHDEPDFDFDIARIPVDNEVKYYAEMFIS
jgi:hypothetical protein